MFYTASCIMFSPIAKHAVAAGEGALKNMNITFIINYFKIINYLTTLL